MSWLVWLKQFANKYLGGQYSDYTYSDEILEFDPLTGQWKLVDRMIQARRDHAVSTIHHQHGKKQGRNNHPALWVQGVESVWAFYYIFFFYLWSIWIFPNLPPNVPHSKWLNHTPSIQVTICHVDNLWRRNYKNFVRRHWWMMIKSGQTRLSGC